MVTVLAQRASIGCILLYETSSILNAYSDPPFCCHNPIWIQNPWRRGKFPIWTDIVLASKTVPAAVAIALLLNLARHVMPSTASLQLKGSKNVTYYDFGR